MLGILENLVEKKVNATLSERVFTFSVNCEENRITAKPYFGRSLHEINGTCQIFLSLRSSLKQSDQYVDPSPAERFKWMQFSLRQQHQPQTEP